MSEREPLNTGSAESPAPLSTAAPGPKRSPLSKGSAIVLLVVGVIAVFTIIAVIFTPRTSGPVGNAEEAGFIGTWSSELQSLTISQNGEARGTDGCNGQGSTWSYTDGELRFGGFIGTEMACLDDEGNLLNGWLGKATTASFEGSDPDRLTFYDRDGKSLGALSRTAEDGPLPGEVDPTSPPLAPGPLDDPGPVAGGGLETPDPRPMNP